MPRYVVHIGPAKTGTDYLQGRLFDCRAPLKAAGILYPDLGRGCGTDRSHEGLCDLIKARRYADLRSALQQLEDAGCHTIVLSSAGLAELSAEQLTGLRDCVGDHPAQFVYYCRRWSERITLEWIQGIRTGSHATLPEYHAQYVRHPLASAGVNYSLVWERFCNLFGRESLQLVSYNNLRDKGIDLFDHFARTFLGWHDDTAYHADEAATESPGTRDIEIARALNQLHAVSSERHQGDLLATLMRLRTRIDTRALERLMADETSGVEVSDGAEVFHEPWKALHQYADRLVNRVPGQSRLFEMRTLTAPYVRADYLIRERAGRELRRIDRELQTAAGATTLPP